MNLSPSVGILGSLVLVALTGCSGAAQEASSNEVPVAQQVTFGTSVALSADGGTLAVEAYGENSAATGVGGNQTVSCTPPVTSCAASAGAVYLY